MYRICKRYKLHFAFWYISKWNGTNRIVWRLRKHNVKGFKTTYL